jgi:uncharacterized protein (TIGR02145 family)
MNYHPLYFSYFIFILSASLHICAQSITGVDHFQQGQHIRIVYELQTSTPVEIQVMYSKDFGKTFSPPLKQVSGALGKGITAGSKEIIWRVLEELPELVSEGVVFRVRIAGGEWRPGMVHCTGTPTEIVEVRNPVTGRVWMDRNLGASRAATSSTDAAAYGDLYQWGRFGDGHQCRNSGRTANLSSTNTPGHGNFIITGGGDNYDWRSPQNNNLWQGVNGINNPCPSGFRLPTDSEWYAEFRSWKANNSSGAFASHLKLLMGGDRNITGSLRSVGSYGYYWSATVSGLYASYLFFGSTLADLYTNGRGGGLSVRCLQD